MTKIKYMILTLVALMATTGAWATDDNTVVWDNTTWAESVTTHTVGDITITATGSGKVYQSTTSGEPLALQAGANDAITFTSNGKPFASIAIMTDDELNVAGWTYNSSTWSYEWSGEPTTSVTLSGCDIKADKISFTFGTSGTVVSPVTGKTNEWTLTMPAGDVELEIVYKTQSQLALTFNNAEITTEGLTGYVGLEDEFAGSLGFAIEGLDAAMGFTFESDNTAVMAFGENNEAMGTLQDIKFLAAGEANLKVKFAGTDDYSKAEATVKVTVKEKTYTVTLAEGTVDVDKWTIDPTEAKAGTEIKATYSGTKRVKKVTAVIKGAAAPATPTLLEFEPGGKKFYYYEGETWKQAIDNHPENAANGWRIDEDDETVYNNNSELKGKDHDDEVYGYSSVDATISYIWYNH